MVRYFYGEDTYAARAALRQLVEEKAAALRWLDEQGAAEGSLAGTVGRGSKGLFGQEIIVARDASTWPAQLQRDLLAALPGAGSSEVIVWDRGPRDLRSVLYTYFKKRNGSEVREFAFPEIVTVTKWLQEEARRRGGTITESAARLLTERAGRDRWRLSTELDKLLVAAGTVDAEAVRKEIPPTAAAEIFGMLDALARGQAQPALQQVQVLLERGESEFYILSMLAYQFRTLHAIRRGIDRGVPPGRIAASAGLKPYTVQKNYPHARHFTADYLRDTLARILACDFAIRRGKVDQRTALLMLVLTLALRPRG